MVSIVLRKPCEVHASCDETGCRLLHTPKKYTELSKEERLGGHEFCEGDLPKIRIALKATGSWTCPVCGTVSTYKDGVLSPNIVQLYDALGAE